MDIAALKIKTLELAFQGKLTQQTVADGNVEVLLNELTAKSKKKVKRVNKEEVPFVIPDSWRWIYLGDVCSAVTGRLDANQQDDSGKYPFFTCGAEVYKTLEYAFDCDAILLGGNNASGDYKMHRYNGKFNAYQRVYVITDPPHEMLDYLYWVVRYWLPHLKYNSQGATTRFIKIGQVNGMLIPLPPMMEQIRIVDTIKLVFEQLDIISELQSIYLKDVNVLKRKLVDAAVQGKLKEQLLEDGTAEELYVAIQEEKDKLIKEGKIKKTKLTPAIANDEIPFEIPLNWKWVRLEELAANINIPMADGPFGSNLKKEHYTENREVRIIQLSNVGDLGWRNENVKYTTFEYLKTIERSAVNAGDIVIAKMMPAGRAIIVPDIEKQYVLSSDCVKFVPHPLLSAKYINYAINSEIFRKQVLGTVTGVGRERTSLSKLKNFLIPIPPYAEQVRIVQKLDTLLGMI